MSTCSDVYKCTICLQFTDSQQVRISPTVSKPYAYSVKVTNLERKSDYTIKKLKSTSKFTSVEEVQDSFRSDLEFVPSEFGFIEPGHGLKGRQKWIRDDVDLEEMYTDHPRKQDFLFWCYSNASASHKIVGQKRATPTEIAAATPKSKSTCIRKINEVEDIIKGLQEKHGTKFSVEQFNMWAHVIHIGKHSSHEVPPDLPYFRQSHKKTTSSSELPIATSSSSVSVSPGKRVSLRSECINQLDKWHSLLEKGVITQKQYEDMQETILSDMFKF